MREARRLPVVNLEEAATPNPMLSSSKAHAREQMQKWSRRCQPHFKLKSHKGCTVPL